MFEALMQKAGLSTRSYGTQSSYNAVERAVHIAPNLNNDKTFDAIINYGTDNVFYDSYAAEVWVYVAISSIAEACGQVPLKIYDVRDRLKPVDVTYDPRFKALLHPNSRMSRYRLFESTHSFLRLMGSCYWEITGTVRAPENIYILRPDYVTVIPDAKRGVKGYEYYPKGPSNKDDVIKFAPDEIVAFHTFNPYTQDCGLSPLSSAKLSIAADLLAMKYNISFFENHASPYGVYTTENTLNPSTLEKLSDQLISMRQNLRSAFTPIILQGGLKYSPTSLPPKDVEFEAGRNLNRQDILSSQKVPATVAAIAQANFSEAKQQAQVFRDSRILPSLRALQADIDTFLLQYIGPGLECLFDTNSIAEYRDDERAHEERLRIQFDRSIISVDEYLVAIRKAPIGGIMGKRRYLLASLYEVDEEGVHLPIPDADNPSGRTGKNKSKAYIDVETNEIVNLQNILDNK